MDKKRHAFPRDMIMNENNGLLDLVFRKKENNKTYLAKKYFKLPLQVMPVHYQDKDGTAFLYLLNPSGGVLQHDRLTTQIKVESGAKALVTTPGNTKFYKMDEGYAKVNNIINVEGDGVLEYLPEHNVPFAESTVYQNNEYHLSENSTLIGSDIVTAGRVSRGEIFHYNKYSSKTSIFVEGKLEAYDNVVIEPKKEDVNRMGIMGDYLTNGTLYIYKKNMTPQILEKVNDLIKKDDPVKVAGSMITPSLLIIRLLANNTIDLQESLTRIWSVLRESLLGKKAVRIRKY